jgi:hypothetical protein
MSVREICAKVGRSERTVRRILDALPPADQAAGDGPPHPQRLRQRQRQGTNGATVTRLADPVTSG